MAIRVTHSYAERAELAADLAWQIANQLLSAVDESGMARLLVSGGGTPKLLFNMLSEIDLPWEAIHIGLVDDRCVSPDDERSNVKLIREFLMLGEAGQAVLEPLYDPALGIEASAAAACEFWDAPDVVILGMGSDGHTASLFPGSPQLASALADDGAKIVHTEPTMEPMVDRLTLNAAAIMEAGWTALHIEGAGKRELFADAKVGNASTTPISHFLNHPTFELDVYWAP